MSANSDSQVEAATLTSNDPAHWTARYRETLRSLGTYVQHAPTVAAGFSVCNDHIVDFDSTDYAAVIDGAASDNHEVRTLSSWLLDRIGTGRGGEILTGREGFDWLTAHFTGVPTMGGTGAQVARVLAAIGGDQVVALSDRSATQLDTFDERLLLVDHRGNRVAPSKIARSTDPANDAIYVFQFVQGTRLSDDFTTKRSTRIILRAPARPLDLDDNFARYVQEHQITTLLLSGFQTASPAAVTPTRAWFAESFAWLMSRDRLVHFELAEYESREHMVDTITQFSTFVNSLGMSLSELAQFSPGVSPVAAALDVAETFGFDRVSIHADDFAFAVSTRDPKLEEAALLSGCLLAATRAVTGTPQLPHELPAGTTIGVLPDELTQTLDSPNYRLTAVPSPYAAAPVATLGLGDTFVAGMLLALGSSPS